ncbi:DUF3016 domain-containing protein [Draconibacterium mangrovi]|uniref:DUF3016 domain-containing protein n=1 Tax=Draconibacterium mangrovi TaxID=2697469 RepID=UPI0013D17625|nr:DUF3016 domain-containing protein [Draconibacterium mangrovi]
MKSIVFIIVILLFANTCFSQSSLNGNESYFEKSHILVQHINDIDLLFSGKSNDVAFTSSFLVKAFFNQKTEKQRLLSFGIRTDLYTKRQYSQRFDENGRYYRGESFTEISTAEFSWVKFLTNNLAIQLSGGPGILNKKKPIPGLALWIQGGKDGAGGIHKIIDSFGKQHGQIIEGRDVLTHFLYFNPAVIYYLNLFPKSGYTPHTLVSELGVNLCDEFAGNWIFFENDLNLHLFRFPLSKRLFSVDLTGAGDFRLHRAGLKTDIRLGTEISWGRITFGYELTNQYGKENIDWVDYYDNDDIYRIYFKIRLKKQKGEYLSAGTNKA